ncbi:MAG: TIGR02452 family protein [Deltaproteobacteria bacterium]|nr:TIGR02452 family protein [Deltaproteobacteria bacterium]
MSFDFHFTPSRGPSRAECARQGREAVEIASRGAYEAPSGRRVDLAAAVASAIARTRDYAPEDHVPEPAGGARVATRISVVNGTSLASARAIASRTRAVPFVLNFASAKNPGGGFLNGARAQEESLARASALYPTIVHSRMYAHHRASHDCMYTSWMIHSPEVPVFRDDESGVLLEEPYPCTFLTAPAPNAGVVLARTPSRRDELERVMAERVARVLAIAAAEGHRHLVLGAWGCGVFANDPRVVTRAFQVELGGRFAGVFEEVVFAVLDWSEERRFVRPFAESFAS